MLMTEYTSNSPRHTLRPLTAQHDGSIVDKMWFNRMNVNGGRPPNQNKFVISLKSPPVIMKKE